MGYGQDVEDPPRWRKWLKVVGVIVLFIILGRVAGWITGTAITSEPANPTAEQLVADAVAGLDKQLPAQINEFVTVTSVEAKGAELVQRMSVTRNLSDEDMVAVRKGDQSEVCSNARYRQLLDKGGAVRFVYRDVDGDILEFRVGQCRVPVI